ncbi:hypothetical protein BGZ60DRAFT_520440 [Tricladium varicosporioides]|nr:hypothetical protein BGZ60DRAFT_520440 [Hymenoscyphus varicosporioides]
MATTSIFLKSTSEFDGTMPQPSFTIIEAFLRNSLDPDATATELVKLVMDEGCLDLNPQSFLHPLNYIPGISGECISIATQIPYSHPWHYRLASLLIALKKQPAPPKAVYQTCTPDLPDTYEFHWDQFPELMPMLHDFFGYKNRWNQSIRSGGRDGGCDSDCWSPIEWLNINTFVSILVGEKFAPFELLKGCAQLGLTVIRNTLEVTPRDVGTLEDNVPSCVVWIMNAGKWMRENPDLDSHTSWMERGVDPFAEKKGMSDERWSFWKGRLTDLQRRSDLSKETRGWAKKAVEFMDK